MWHLHLLTHRPREEWKWEQRWKKLRGGIEWWKSKRQWHFSAVLCRSSTPGSIKPESLASKRSQFANAILIRWNISEVWGCRTPSTSATPSQKSQSILSTDGYGPCRRDLSHNSTMLQFNWFNPNYSHVSFLTEELKSQWQHPFLCVCCHQETQKKPFGVFASWWHIGANLVQCLTPVGGMAFRLAFGYTKAAWASFKTCRIRIRLRGAIFKNYHSLVMYKR